MDTVHRRRLAHQARQRIGVHHAADAEIILDPRRDRQRDGSALPFQNVDLDKIADTDTENGSQPVRNRQPRFGQDDGAQIDVDDAAQIGVRVRPPIITRRSRLPLRCARDAAIGLGVENARQARHLEDGVAGPFLDKLTVASCRSAMK